MATITISEDTVWTAGTVIQDSQISFVGGAKLTIENGVTVGNSTFNGGAITVLGGAVIENSHFTTAFNLVLDGDAGNPVRFNNSSITGWSYFSGSLRIDNTIFNGGSINMVAEEAGSVFSLTNSTFNGTGFASYTWNYLRAGASAVIENNVFVGAGAIFSLGGATFKNNVYYNYSDYNGGPIQGRSFTAIGNSFFSNGQKVMSLQGDVSQIHLSGNWWGTTDEAAIRAMISTIAADPGIVDISGYLTAPSTTAPDYAPPFLTLSAGVAAEGEGTTYVPITVTLSAAQTYAVGFTYHMAGITAVDGVDFQPLGGMGTIPAGQTQVVIQVPILPDNVPEAPETFFVQLLKGTGAVVGGGLGTRLTVTIQDDDTARLAGNDMINGGAGSDMLWGGGGNDTINGGAGIDAALYGGNKADYTLTTLADGTLQVRDNRADSPDGTDILSNVDVLVFNKSAHFIKTLPATSAFDEQAYLLFNPDVAAAVKAGVYETGHDHWVKFGYAEKGRLEINLVDEAFYLRENPDVAAAVQAGNFASGRQHWEMYGRTEGRAPDIFFDAHYYLTKYDDLAHNLGTDAKAALTHWLNFGIHEGRSASPYFNVAAYIAANPDLANIQSSGLEHFMVFGYGEGRAAPVDTAWFGIA